MPRHPGERHRLGQPSMADVAAKAGVAPITVSRVANGNASVKPATRQRVEQAMADLGYRANTAARALATGRFNTIGVITFDLTATGNLIIADSVIREAQRLGYAINLATLDTADDASLQAAVRRLTDRAIDGLIVIEARILDTPSLRLPDNLPVVVAEGDPDDDHPSIGIDHAAGAATAVEHLLGLGHPTVHHITGLADSHPSARRRAGWQQTLTAHGRPVPQPQIGDWSATSGYRAALELLSDDGVTAIFAANDQMAAGALRAAAEVGRRVPDELSVVGYDASELARYLGPPLTSVRHDLVGVGTNSVGLLVSMITGEDRPTVDRPASPELVVGASTAPPPTGATGPAPATG